MTDPFNTLLVLFVAWFILVVIATNLEEGDSEVPHD